MGSEILMDMVLLFTEPGHLILGDGLRDDALETMGLYSGQMPWWVQSDMLVTKKRELVGIVLYAGESDAHKAQQLATVSDPKVVRYLPTDEAVKLPRYKGLLGSNVSALELRWSSIEPDLQEVAQLNDDWYYKTAHPTKNECVCAWGYPGIERILASNRLTLPESHY
jgi:hypothetical protein